ncbi:MAG: TlyA family RNA methyltransferase [Candidatus Dependentiae bacterium]|nr:TlyA family RNA methyltransferase [Candidatus Dependentiae bacterium]
MDTEKQLTTHKKRLDHVLAQLYPNYSRRQLQSWIVAGNVMVDGIAVSKNSYPIFDGMEVELVVEKPKYVSRAGFKLESALDHFHLEVSDKTILDAGLSTGGFTDCLLQHGAKKVYGVDVGFDQVHGDIRADDRVVVMEHVNVRELPTLDELVDMVTLDLSFISVLKVMDTVKRVLRQKGDLVVLIKPQFEVGKHAVGRGGIVKDAAEHKRAILLVTSGIELAGFTQVGVIDSPLEGADGNKEFLAYFIKN